MKRCAFIAVACVMATIVTRAALAETGDEAQIRALEDQFIAAFKVKDTNAIMAVYSGDVFVFDVVPPRQYVGAEAYRQDWNAFFKVFDGPIDFTISDLALIVDGNLAVSHSIQRLAGKTTKGDQLDLTVRVTDAYKKTNGKWLIVHEHVSVPVDLETGKPDLSSKP